jgi:protease-4
MSENDRMQREALLYPIWDEMKSLMAEGRGLNQMISNLLQMATLDFLVKLPLGILPMHKQTILLMGPNHFQNFVNT